MEPPKAKAKAKPKGVPDKLAAVQEENRILQQQLAEAKASMVAGDDNSTNPDDTVSEEKKELQAQLAAVQEAIDFIKATKASSHHLLGYDVPQRNLELQAKRTELQTRIRGILPLADQQKKTKTFVDSATKRLEAEQKKAEGIQKQMEELLQKSKEQADVVALWASKLNKAKAELADIEARLAPSDGTLRGELQRLSNSDEHRKALADAHTCLARPDVLQALVNQGLPAEQQAHLASIVSTLADLAKACRASTNPAPAPQAPVQGQAPAQAHGQAFPITEDDEPIDMEADADAIIDEVALATLPEIPGEEAEARDARMVESRANLKSARSSVLRIISTRTAKKARTVQEPKA